MTTLATDARPIDALPSAEATTWFESLAEMQEQHSALVKEVGNEVLSPGNPEKIARFVARGVATGKILDDKDDRAAAQSLINFWVSRLSSAASDARRSAAKGQVAAAPASGPEIDDTLLGEFDPSTITSATGHADRWLETLPAEDRALVRRIMLRLARLSGQGEAFEPVPATRASLEELDPSPERVGRLIEGLAAAGVVRVTPGATPETDLISVRPDVMTQWEAFRRWTGERLSFRHAVIAWDRDGRSRDALLREEALEEARWYNDRNPLEREFIELSGREEILRARRVQEKSLQYLLAAVVLGICATLILLMLARSYYNWLRAESQGKLAEQQAERAKKQEKLAIDRVDWLQQMQVSVGRRDLSRTLGEVALAHPGERPILVRRLFSLNVQFSNDQAVVDFFKEKHDLLKALGNDQDRNRGQGFPKQYRTLQYDALKLSRDMRQRLREIFDKRVLSDDLEKAMRRQRKALYETVGFCASKIVEIASNSQAAYHDASPFLKEYWVLYWGEMGLVEQNAVADAMKEFGETLRSIDERIVEKIHGNPEFTNLRQMGAEDGFTPRQAIQNYYDKARSLVRPGSKDEDVTRVRLEPDQDPQDKKLLESLRANLDALKAALNQEENGPLF
jgi:hypothetical protein